MDFKGRAHLLGDDINTDYIIASKYRSMGLDFKGMAEHLLEDLDPKIAGSIRKGDFLVSGRNFGCGSSREFAPRVIQEAGISAVLAPSYARIFYRNALNIGLCLLECNTRGIGDGDTIEIDLKNWVAKDLTRNFSIPITPLPPFMIQILNDGGLVPHFKKWGGFHMIEGDSL
jgi:3-isopropylmalate/(R)-2-methylmalate dehydratase small subunit